MFSVYAIVMPRLGKTGGRRRDVLHLSIRLFIHARVVHSSVTKLVNTIFWKWMNQFWCQLAQMVNGAMTWNGQLWGSGGQRSRWHTVNFEGQEVKDQGDTRPKYTVSQINCAFLFLSELCQISTNF